MARESSSSRDWQKNTRTKHSPENAEQTRKAREREGKHPPLPCAFEGSSRTVNVIEATQFNEIKKKKSNNYKQWKWEECFDLSHQVRAKSLWEHTDAHLIESVASTGVAMSGPLIGENVAKSSENSELEQ